VCGTGERARARCQRSFVFSAQLRRWLHEVPPFVPLPPGWTLPKGVLSPPTAPAPTPTTPGRASRAKTGGTPLAAVHPGSPPARAPLQEHNDGGARARQAAVAATAGLAAAVAEERQPRQPPQRARAGSPARASSPARRARTPPRQHAGGTPPVRPSERIGGVVHTVASAAGRRDSPASAAHERGRRAIEEGANIIRSPAAWSPAGAAAVPLTKDSAFAPPAWSPPARPSGPPVSLGAFLATLRDQLWADLARPADMFRRRAPPPPTRRLAPAAAV